MTEEKEKRPLIEYAILKPFVDAGALGLAFGSPFLSSGNFWGMFIFGSSISFTWYWVKGNIPPIKRSKKRADYITVNSINGSRKVHRFDYQHYITRDSNVFSSFWNNVIKPKSIEKPRQQLMLDKPHVLKEFIFLSSHEGGIELLENDVRRFLFAAWKSRERGSGISQRRWVRDWKQRPQWYKDLGPVWYYAFLVLIRNAQQITKRQLIIVLGHQQYGLKYDPHTTLSILKWAEAQKRNIL